MDKTEISRISMQMLDGEFYGNPIVVGKDSEILTMATEIVSDVLHRSPNFRRKFRFYMRRILRETKQIQERNDTMILGILFAVFGFFALYGFVWWIGFAAHWIGVV